MAATSVVSSPKSAGQRLIDELRHDGDSFSVRFLINQAAIHADHLEKLRRLLDGDDAEWFTLGLGPQVVAVRVDSPLREHRQLSTELRHLIAEIHKQRAGVGPGGGSDDDDDVTQNL